ncbi:HK97-gp10 family putative phage morphogenesis protein [Nocardioides massiliensis]|uniref:HK97 gp10 family phage protein n=1 Tax=Nocardioides massiliensis TaxID=1325935 RepID=A0ABT9NIZ3_9ACTN|nr:HK97-gp10 family putative phage morphogenesis protein [Nocardioides massiliensis]MDP9820386.1 HK97 gp10 family phage protein [Nocardioides massiliensis]
MTIEFDASQVRALGARVGQAPERVGAKAAAAFRKTVRDIEADAKVLAPVDTGALRGSISSTTTGDGRYGHTEAEIGPTVDYGIYVEWGTSVQPGQPYLGPAFDRRAPTFTEALAQLATENL